MCLNVAACIAMALPTTASANAVLKAPPPPKEAAAAAASEYDQDQVMILDGFVKSIDWSGPQLKILFHWIDGYDGLDWEVVAPKPAKLLRMGWTKEIIKADDRMDAVIHPKKDGSQGGELMRIILDDGRTIEVSPFGSTEVIPRQHLDRTFSNAADDPMFGYYGNTQDFYAENPDGPPSANYSGRARYKSDHTLEMFSIDMDKDRKFKRSLNYGTWWLQEYKGKWTRCMLFNFARRPFCHSPVNFEKVGAKWQITFHGRGATWFEHREIQPGQY